MKQPFLYAMVAGAAGAIVASLIPLFVSPTKAETKLLPFQGRLTDAAGNAVGDGAKVVEFKMYDAPTGGNVKWAGEVHKLSVNGGLVNTMFGSKAGLGSVDFSSATFLQITVDANNDGQITAADPPLLPRQSVVPAVFAMEAAKARDASMLQGTTWASIIDNGDPSSGRLKPSLIGHGAVPATAITANDGLTAAQLAPSSVQSSELAADSVNLAHLKQEVINTLVPAGTIIAYAGAKTGAGGADNLPPGWLLCDGSALKSTRPEYAALFARIQKSWGDGTTASIGARLPAIAAGSEQTDFNIPDLRGFFLRGVDDNAGRDPNSGSSTNSGADGLRYTLNAGGSLGNAVGSIQRHAFERHTHTVRTGPNASGGASDYLVKATPTSGRDSFTPDLVNAEGGSETRPVNAYVHYIIKY